MNLSAKNVHDVFVNCLYNNENDNQQLIEGVETRCYFRPDRLKFYEPFITLMLDDLHNNFKRSGGEGWSFLNMCDDKDGNQWADLHQTMDELVCLGMAIGKVSFVMPREDWHIFPGGMPYIVID